MALPRRSSRRERRFESGGTISGETTNGTLTNIFNSNTSISLSGANTFNIGNAGCGAGLTINPGLAGTGSVAVTRNNSGSAGTFALNGTNSGYSGNITITGRSSSRTIDTTIGDDQPGRRAIRQDGRPVRHRQHHGSQRRHPGAERGRHGRVRRGQRHVPPGQCHVQCHQLSRPQHEQRWRQFQLFRRHRQCESRPDQERRRHADPRRELSYAGGTAINIGALVFATSATVPASGNVTVGSGAVSIAPVPEPGTLMLLAAAAVLVLAGRRRRFR
jgi:hypothetical protein